MNFVLKDLEELKQKVKDLAEKYKQVLEERNHLKKENDLLKKETEKWKSRCLEKQKEQALDLFSQTLVGNNQTKEEAEKQVDRWLKTIDKTIRYLRANE